MDPAQINTKAATDSLQHSLNGVLSTGCAVFMAHFTYEQTDSAMTAICVATMTLLGMLSFFEGAGLGGRG